MNVDRKKNAERVREHKIERTKGEEEERHLGRTCSSECVCSVMSDSL